MRVEVLWLRVEVLWFNLENTSMDISSVQDEMLEVRFPRSINPGIVETVHKLSQLLKLPEFTATFELKASHQEIMDVVKDNKLVIRFINGSVYNASLVGLPNDCDVDNEYGWFDGRVSRNCININYDFYSETKNNLEYLKVLAVVTAIHELQHFLRAHLKEKSPVQLIPSFRPPAPESGDSWEVKNLGGRLGILSHRKTKNEVSYLYLTSTLNGQEVESLINDSNWTQNIILGVSNGHNVFPLVANPIIHPIPDILFKGKLCHKCQEDSASDVSLTFNDVFYKHVRPNDKLGRKDT